MAEPTPSQPVTIEETVVVQEYGSWEQAYHQLYQEFVSLQNKYDQVTTRLTNLESNPLTFRIVDGPVMPGQDQPEITLQQVEVIEEPVTSQSQNNSLTSVVNATIGGVDQSQLPTSPPPTVMVLDPAEPSSEGVQTRRTRREASKVRKALQYDDQEQTAAIDSISSAAAGTPMEVLVTETVDTSISLSKAVSPAKRSRRQKHQRDHNYPNRTEGPRRIAPKRSGRKLVVRLDDQIRADASVWCCPFCDSIITTKWYLREHLKCVHAKASFLDVVQECRFDSEEPQQRMQKLRTRAEADRWPCPICPMLFTVKFGLKSHLKKVHPIANITFEAIKKIGANSDEAQRRQAELKRNIFRPLTVVPEFIRIGTDFQCPALQCIFRTHSKLGVTTHYESVHLSVKYLCPICTHMSGAAYDMRRHFEKVHPGELSKADKIECIDAADPRVAQRIKDSQSKPNQDMFLCSVPGCDFSAKSRVTTKRHHSKVHQGLRFLCPCCSEFLWTGGELRQHVNQFHPTFTGTYNDSLGVRPDSNQARLHSEQFGLLSEQPVAPLPAQLQADSEGQYLCPEPRCGFSCFAEKYLRAHHSKMHLRMRFLCPWCIEYFFATHELILHVRKYHQGEVLTEQLLVPVQEDGPEDQQHHQRFGSIVVLANHDQLINQDQPSSPVKKNSSRKTGTKRRQSPNKTNESAIDDGLES